jgi:DNA-binding CsgD family transcriptional regulator
MPKHAMPSVVTASPAMTLVRILALRHSRIRTPGRDLCPCDHPPVPAVAERIGQSRSPRGGGVAVLVGAFIVNLTMSVTVAQRTRELALLRCIGADNRQVRRSVLLEALSISSRTVETHAASVLRKLRLSNRQELTRWASTHWP